MNEKDYKAFRVKMAKLGRHTRRWIISIRSYFKSRRQLKDEDC